MGSGLNLDMRDLDDLLAVHAPHLLPSPGLTPSPLPSRSAPYAPNENPLTSQAPTLQKPTRKESIAAGKSEFKAGMPTVTDEAGTPGFYKQRIAQNEYKTAHPWGSPISEQPGILGKIGHVLGTVGNVAGDILAPATMSLIPGTQLNRQAQEARDTKNLESAQQLETQKEGVEQKPEIAEAAGEQKGRLEAEKEAAQENRLDKTLGAQEQREIAREAASDKTRQEQFGQQEKLESQRESAAEKRLQESLPSKNATREEGRSDRSYQYTSGQLDKLGQPLDQLAQRTGRLIDTMNQRNPQADALVAPELLTVMAGGMGSGLRMNEAEISRIVGGRSVWENLKAAMQHWKTDPESARSITPAQDEQIRKLINEVHSKLTRKQAILDNARQELIDTDDPKDHRRIYADTRRAIDAVDNQEATGGELKPPKEADPGMKWQHRTVDGKVEWRQVKE